MAPIGLADELTLESSSTSRSTFDIAWHDGRAVAWPIERDLLVRAHAAMESRLGRALPVHATLRKHIPAGGGLGGGSADAAAMLRGLGNLFALAIEEPALHALAATLGSDIPYFIDLARPGDAPPRPAIVTGLGDRIERLPTPPPRPLWLFIPPFGCDTAAVYRAFDALAPGPLREAHVRELAKARGLGPAEPLNDLAAAAEIVQPALAGIRKTLAAALGLPIHVTGSGSTLFAWPEPNADPATAAAAAEHAGTRFLPTALR